MSTVIEPPISFDKNLEELETVTIRFAGDSGDGMQLTGTQFTNTSAVLGNDISTLPDFPAEIRAPAGSLPGVSGFQLNFSSQHIKTPGDQPSVLVAMNPAALKVNLADLEEGGTIIINTDGFTAENLKYAKYATNPLDDGTLAGYRVHKLPITTLNMNALKGNVELSRKEIDRCKNFFALGVLYWLYDRPLEGTLSWITVKFGKSPELAKANEVALRTGYNFADTTEVFTTHYTIKKAKITPGKYRKITGNEATAIGFVAASQLAGLPLFYGSYPITPASDILHELARHKSFGVKTFQAEDEIAAVCSAIGASFAGQIGLTGTSGPGVALKQEAIGLAVMTELPLVIINVQRGGPSTGLPTKTEQADLFQAVWGRNGECPAIVIAPSTPADCFAMAIEAVRLAFKYMSPVFYLSDGYLANGAEPWAIPAIDALPKIDVKFTTDPDNFMPYSRDKETLARPFAIPGTPGLEHRIGGIEKQHITGNVNYDPENHHLMVKLRQEKIDRVANDIPPVEVFGEKSGKVLVLGWGSTYGSISTAVEQLQSEGKSVSSAHLRHLNPFPKNLGEVLAGFETVIIPEMNLGQLATMVRAKYLVDAIPFSKVKGRPFQIREIVRKVEEYL
ncbi:MAG TPA: 2-oxoacid:acceptor oxidoreductase subunit alpha [Pyrinomonadaceae bacterium]|nr:2-oxoacid:acceptor oxidoreductase subunit alpha [Pyrinomonadaceae bacterium]